MSPVAQSDRVVEACSTTNTSAQRSNTDRSDNAGRMPGAIRDAIRRAQIEAINSAGCDPCTKPQAAAHEAGHVVVAHAIGIPVLSARLVRRTWGAGEIWTGHNKLDAPGEPFQIADNPNLAFVTAINSISGFIGETAAGLSHESSSIDERCIAQSAAKTLDLLFGAPPLTFADAMAAVCDRALRENRRVFDVIRGHLERERRLTTAQARRMLGSVQQIDVRAHFARVLEDIAACRSIGSISTSRA